MTRSAIVSKDVSSLSTLDLFMGDGEALKRGLLWSWAVALGLDDEFVLVGGIEQGGEIVGIGATVGLD